MSPGVSEISRVLTVQLLLLRRNLLPRWVSRESIKNLTAALSVVAVCASSRTRSVAEVSPCCRLALIPDGDHACAAG